MELELCIYWQKVSRVHLAKPVEEQVEVFICQHEKFFPIYLYLLTELMDIAAVEVAEGAEELAG